MNEEPNELAFILTLPREIRLIISEYINSAARAQRLRAFELYARYCQRSAYANERVVIARRKLTETQAMSHVPIYNTAFQRPSASNPMAFMNPHEIAHFSHTIQCIYGGAAQDPALIAEAQSKYKQACRDEGDLQGRVITTGADYAAKKATHEVCLYLCVVLSRVRGNTP